MAKNHNSKNKHNGHSSIKIVVVTVICVCLVAVATFGILYFINRKQETTETPKTTETSKSEKTEEKTTETEEDDEEKWSKTQQDEGGNPNKLPNLTGVINHAGVSEGKLIVSVMIDQSLGSSSTCEFTLTHDSGTTINGTSSVEPGPSTSYCSYSTSTNNLKKGHYKINVKMKSPDKAGETEGEVSI